MFKITLFTLCISIASLTFSFAQNVGVGTATPMSKLDVAGGISIGTNYAGSIAAPADGAIIEGSVGIGISAPDASAQAQISATNKGLLIPNVSLSATNVAAPVTAPATSLLVYNTVTAGVSPNNVVPGFYYWNGTAWVKLDIAASGGGGGDWHLSGNGGTIAANNFIGTTDNIDFVTRTNNAERMRVTGAGNVGIGTAAPNFKLEVQQDMTMDGDVTAAQIVISGATNNGKRMIFGYDTNGNGFGFIKSGNYGVTWTPIALQPNGGNVGIGTSTPGFRLTTAYNTTGASIPVSGTTDPATGFRLTTGIVALDMGTITNGTSYIQNRNINDFTTSYNLAINPIGGNVGIGITNPTENLSVRNAFAPAIFSVSNDNDHFFGVYSGSPGDQHVALISDNSQAIRFGQWGSLTAKAPWTERMRVDVNGNVGIGAAAPGAKLEVNGPSGDENSFGVLRLITPANGANLRMGVVDGSRSWIQSHGSLPLYINNLGNNVILNAGGGSVGIGYTNPSWKLEVAGDIYANGVTRADNGFQVGGGGNYFSILSDGYATFWHGATGSKVHIGLVSGEGSIYPSSGNWGYCGFNPNYWYRVYANDVYTWNSVIWIIYDTYDDLAMLNGIQTDTLWDPVLKHHVMNIRSSTIPKMITNYDEPNYDPNNPFVSQKKLTGFLLGTARQLDREGKERDTRLAARTDMLAEAIGVDFSQTAANTFTKHISEQGKAEGNGTSIKVSFSEDFQKQMKAGDEPMISITPRSEYQTYYVSEVNEKGFTLMVKTNEKDFRFNWLATTTVQVNSEAHKEARIDDIFYKNSYEVKGDFPTLDYEAERAYKEKMLKDSEANFLPNNNEQEQGPVILSPAKRE